MMETAKIKVENLNLTTEWDKTFSQSDKKNTSLSTR